MKKKGFFVAGSCILLVLIGVLVWLLIFNKREEKSSFNLEDLEQSDTMLDAPVPAQTEAAKKAGRQKAVIETEKGRIVVELRGDLMPYTVANFVQLIQRNFYDGLFFHRVEDWVIQGGDPEGTGAGGPGYAIKLEVHKALKNVRGAVAMARTSDPDSAGSQFYILKSDAAWLDGNYAVFGTVLEGMEAVDKIKQGDKMLKITLE
ncbi:MAG: peptidylprolyl isomerase [Bacillota bacterium]